MLQKIAFMVDSSGCWICTSHKPLKHEGKKYYQTSINGVTDRLHRHIYRMCHGPIEKDAVVRHTCDNPLCINPAHLKEGTHQDNVQDRVDRDRSARGERNGRAKLTEANVRDIRSLTKVPNSQLAWMYGVDRKVIYNIRRRKSWRHVS